VIVACKSPSTTCTGSDGTLFCSTSAGLCIESTTTAVTSATYPTINLIGQAVLGVTQGISYLACPTPQPTNVICDRYRSVAVCMDLSSCSVHFMHAHDVLMMTNVCYAMLCYAMLCYAMLCYAMLCYAMLCYAVLCCAVLCYAVLCYAVLLLCSRDNFN